MKVRTHTLASQGSVPISGHNGTELGVTAVLNVSTHSLQVESGCRPEVICVYLLKRKFIGSCLALYARLAVCNTD